MVSITRSTLSNKLLEPNGYANVLDYDATGEGVIDDTNAIMAALEENHNIYLPPGTYLCNLDINNTESFNILGAGRTTILKSYDTLNTVVWFNATDQYIWHSSIKNLTIDGNEYTSTGLKLTGAGVNACTKVRIQGLLIQNCEYGIYMAGADVGTQVYKNKVSDCQLLHNTTGIYTENSGYLQFSNIDISCKEDDNTTMAIYNISGDSLFETISTDGPIRNDGSNTIFLDIHIEGMAPTLDNGQAFRDAGYNTTIALHLQDVPSAKCLNGYACYNGPHNILSLNTSGDNAPSYCFAPTVGSSGVVVNLDVAGILGAEYITINDLKDWKILGYSTFFAGLIKREVYGTSTPSTGAWLLGDRTYNTNPSPGGYLGWVCTTAGAPGVWKGFGIIES